jgi:D-alanine-D-alanine ligase
MKVAVVYNRISKRVINLFGVPNREKYGLASIKRITDGLKAGGHQTLAIEGDKDLLDALEEFMPRVLEGERPGLVFNLSYGIQGEARYTHVPGMLEMAGIPYVGSGPLAHSLALDKVVAKMIFRQHGLPTPDFAVVESLEQELPDLPFPLIVKPQSEAVSFGLRVVDNPDELREAVGVILERFAQPVLVERYIAGREVNVGLLGNDPLEALPPAELGFPDGPQIYTYEDKTGKSGREIQVICPARLDEETTARAQDLARQAFRALRCADCARVDMRIDEEGGLWLLEINSLPSMGQRGSYVAAAAAVGLDFAGLVNRLVEVASARYFGTPSPPRVAGKGSKPDEQIFAFLTGRRDRMERRLRDWTRSRGRTNDPIGIRESVSRATETMEEIGLVQRPELGNRHHAQVWESPAGLDGGTLLVANLDVPLSLQESSKPFRRDPELLHGEGVASSRGSLVTLEYALRAVRSARLLAKLPLGVVLYTDEGRGCEDSADVIREAAARASRVLVLQSGISGDRVVTARRGERSYRLAVSGPPQRLGQRSKGPRISEWFAAKAIELAALSDSKQRLAVGIADLQTRAFPGLLPHELTARIVMSYPSAERAEETEQRIREILGKGGPRWSLDLEVARPPMRGGKRSTALYDEVAAVARRWEIPLDKESSVWPSPAGLVPAEVPCLCGLGPVGQDKNTPDESIHRISLVQRTLLLATLLAETAHR